MEGRILRISLDDETISQEHVEDACVESLYEEVDEHTFVIVFPGSAGTIALYMNCQSGRFSRDASQSTLAVKMNALGIVAVVVSGSAHRLSYLYASDDDISIYHCENIRFSSPHRFFQLLASDPSDGCMSIGEAGEKGGALGACLLDSSMCIGRGGLAAMMGSMNFKGIIAHTASSVRPDVSSSWPHSRTAKSFSLYGSASLVDCGMRNGWLPTRYFSGLYDPRCVYLDGRMACRTYNADHVSCPMCTIACRLEENGEALADWAEAMALGSNMGIFSLEKVNPLRRACISRGLDPVDTGEVLSYLKTLEHVPYTLADVRNADVGELERVISLIASRKGNGEALSAGLCALDGALSVEGRSCIYDFRGCHGQALFSSLGENTPCHVDLVKGLHRILDDETIGRVVAYLRLFTHAMENSGLPPFFMLPMHFDQVPFTVMRLPMVMRRIMSSFARKCPAPLSAGLESVDAFDRLHGPAEKIPDRFMLPASVGYTDELNMVRLFMGYQDEMQYIRRKVASGR